MIDTKLPTHIRFKSIIPEVTFFLEQQAGYDIYVARDKNGKRIYFEGHGVPENHFFLTFVSNSGGSDINNWQKHIAVTGVRVPHVFRWISKNTTTLRSYTKNYTEAISFLSSAGALIILDSNLPNNEIETGIYEHIT